MKANDENETELFVLELLKQVKDPELDLNIVDLGLVYEIEYNCEKQHIRIAMTFSTKACPMSDAILLDMRNRINKNFPNDHLTIDVVWEPEWSTDRVSEEGRLALGI